MKISKKWSYIGIVSHLFLVDSGFYQHQQYLNWEVLGKNKSEQ